METFTLAALGFATFVLAGLVKGTLGLGLPTVAMGLLSLGVPPSTAAAVLIIPSMVTNVWQMLAGPDLLPLARRLWLMLAGIALGTVLGSHWFGIAGSAAMVALGAVLVAYAALGLTRVRLAVAASAEPWLGAAAGFATGLVTAATGVFVIPAVPYLQALGLDKDDLVQALGLSFTVSTVALGVGLASEHVLDLRLAGASVLALLPAGIGMVAGQWLRIRVSAAVFRACFFTGLMLLGIHLALRPLL